MKHLGVLKHAGLVLVRRSGRVRWNHLNTVPLREMYERWVSRLDDQWAESMVAIWSSRGSRGGGGKERNTNDLDIDTGHQTADHHPG